ncbi:MAG: hypothetical protein GY855_04955, partial [candidate division Zixibacteria bacterium]|nr:hypothetical protein [candidate division Zixibacteria bacterium]
MKREISAVFFCGIIILLAGFTHAKDYPTIRPLTQISTNNPSSEQLIFTENKGQWDPQALFRVKSEGGAMWFTPSGINYQFVREATITARENDTDQTDKPKNIECLIIKASFEGANQNPLVSGDKLLNYKSNYFLDNDPERWQTDVQSFEGLIYKDIYSGIDLKYYGKGRQIEYDFNITPGADVSQIQIRYEGVKSIAVNSSGALEVETDWGKVTELRPVIYQGEGTQKKNISGEYQILSPNTFGFKLGADYDASKPAVIDPVLVYSTYLGGGVNDYVGDITINDSGYTYIVGHTYSSDFPTLNGYDNDFNGWCDVYITKLDTTGSNLIYSTYFGGTGDFADQGNSIDLDNTGNIYVTGITYSSIFPLVNEYDGSLGGSRDAFVTKLSPGGDNIIFSTYLGGASIDEANGISIDAGGSAYITGYTISSDFPTINAYSTSYGGGKDIFVTKFSVSGNSLDYSTFLGGTGDDYGEAIVVDATGSSFVTGKVSSVDFPTINYYDNYNDGNYDAFVSKFSTAGNALDYSTYIGTGFNDYANDITIDTIGNAYITGYTYSSTFPAINAYDGSSNGICDIFLTKLNPVGNNLIFSTYLGGDGADFGSSISLDTNNNVYITGWTLSDNFPVINDYDNSYNGGRDVIVTKFSKTGDKLIYSTYLGGTGDDYGDAIAVDSSGFAYVAGRVESSDFPIISPYDDTYN